MASEGGSAVPGRDPTWKYCSLIEAKAKKNADIEDIRSQLRGTMGTHHTHLVNEDNDDEDAEDEDVYMYPIDMHPDERDAYRSAVRASKASNWEREQHENIVGSKRKSVESSTGMGIEPPSPYEIKNKYLEMEYKEMEAYVNQQREKWKTYGCTIMSYGWTGSTKLSIINFMVYSKGTTVFLKSVDASNYIKDHKYIYELLKTIIKEVGKENVVQIVTDNGSAFMKAGKQLMKKYNLYWTPCAVHRIDLIFEDIGKRPSVIEVINNARKITNFIYNHVVPTMSFVYELMHVMKENLIRQGDGDWMFKIIQDRWEKTLKHPLHAAAYFLNPRFQYRRGVGSDPELLQAVHDVFSKLDPTTESLGQFGNEMQKEDSVIEQQLQQSQPWCPPRWVKKIIGCSSGLGLYTWMTKLEILIHELPLMLENLELMLNVCCPKKFTLKVFSKDTDDSLHAALHSHQEIDSTSVGHSSRSSAAGTFVSGYNGSRGGTDDGSDNGGGDIDERRHSQYPINQFTCENDFTHCTQDEDHGSRRAGPGIGAIGKPYKGR
ncbi:hypothetical protein CK203_049801 [Vitis vinifera]|uniref:DUF659 domain-containing protein n=1 Tax=Vitis vinifera TaxID=29760 RepID=A0A438H1T1_VITVI|nr:hypothetical protein CK203_049801 [Vitis vinifera]